MKSSILLALLPMALANPIAVASPEAPASDIAARDGISPECANYNACVAKYGDQGTEACNPCFCNPYHQLCSGGWWGVAA